MHPLFFPDFDSLPNDVKDKLKKGIYTLGESRPVSYTHLLETDNSDAEKFDMTSLLRRTDEFDEEVSVYGVETDLSLIHI